MQRIKITTYVLVILFFTSCTVSSVSVKVQRPADITIPMHIKNVVLANRSLPTKENRAENILEGLISGEGIGADRKGSEYCIMGLTKILTSNDRFSLSNSAGLHLKGTGTSLFAIPLEWNKVNEICNTYDADALIVLETFDSDSRIYEGKSRKRYKKVDGIKVAYLEYPAILSMEIESGWRIYDVKNNKLIDENKFIDIKEFKNWGSSPEDARMHLPSNISSLKTAGFFAGEEMGFRISPIWIKVNRFYYISKHEELKNAKAFVKRNDWENAIKIWKKLSKSSDDKIAGYACFNMALASEIKGELETAIDWANNAKKFGDKKSDSYINTLHKRKLDEEKLKEQINN